MTGDQHRSRDRRRLQQKFSVTRHDPRFIKRYPAVSRTSVFRTTAPTLLGRSVRQGGWTGLEKKEFYFLILIAIKSRGSNSNKCIEKKAVSTRLILEMSQINYEGG